MTSALRTHRRAALFRYLALEVTSDSLVAHYELDGRPFEEHVRFEGTGDLRDPAAANVAHLWFLLAGLSYYKAGAAERLDLGATPVGDAGRALLAHALREGLAEFAFRNDLDLADVSIVGGRSSETRQVRVDPLRVLVPFGGGVDSVVSVETLSPRLDRALFVVSPASGRFEPLEATAAVTGLPIVRATRTLDPQLLRRDEGFYSGHVPVTAMVTLLGVIAALAGGRGGVVMSNEHSASEPNFRVGDLDVNHQWSKSWQAEQLLADAVAELVGADFSVASWLRDRSEVWVAERFSRLGAYHHVFRSCNRAFTQSLERRRAGWCGECDKCLFTNLMLAPFLGRSELGEIFGHEPLSDPAREAQLRVLVGAGAGPKPFECVGDPDESAVALTRVSELDEWRDVALLRALADEVSPDRTFEELLEPLGPRRVPAHWLR